MKENYNERPQETWLEVLHRAPGGAAVAHFCEGIQEMQDEEGNTFYAADHYTMETPYRDGLEKAIQENRTVWLAEAKRKETQEENKTLKTRVSAMENKVAEQDELINELIIAQLGE